MFLKDRLYTFEIIDEFYNIWFTLTKIDDKDSESPQIELYISTVELYSSCTYFIQRDVTMNTNNITLDLGNIYDCNVCNRVCPGIPGQINFSKILDIREGAYTLDFHLQDSVDRYSFAITDEGIRISTSVNSTFSTYGESYPQDFNHRDVSYIHPMEMWEASN